MLRNRLLLGFFGKHSIYLKQRIFSTFQCTDGLVHTPQTQTLCNSINRYVCLVTSRNPLLP